MRTLSANASRTGFLVVGNSLVLASDVEAVLQVCENVAKSILGEMVFAKDNGMPYFETVWVGAPTSAPFEAAFRERVAQVPGVTAIEELTTSQIGDAMRYTATISTIYGTGVING